LRESKRLRLRNRPRSAQADAIKYSCDYSFRSSVTYLNKSRRAYRTEPLACPDGCALFQGFKSIPILRGRFLSIISSDLPANPQSIASRALVEEAKSGPRGLCSGIVIVKVR
jgi:hypothetical protein